MSNSNFMDVNAVAEFMCVSVPTAYKIIRKLNDELEQVHVELVRFLKARLQLILGLLIA